MEEVSDAFLGYEADPFIILRYLSYLFERHLLQFPVTK